MEPKYRLLSYLLDCDFFNYVVFSVKYKIEFIFSSLISEANT